MIDVKTGKFYLGGYFQLTEDSNVDTVGWKTSDEINLTGEVYDSASVDPETHNIETVRGGTPAEVSIYRVTKK